MNCSDQLKQKSHSNRQNIKLSFGEPGEARNEIRQVKQIDKRSASGGFKGESPLVQGMFLFDA